MVWDACVGYRGHKSVLNFHYISLIAGYKEREILLLEKVKMNQQTFYSLIFISVFLNICLLDDDRFLTKIFLSFTIHICVSLRFRLNNLIIFKRYQTLNTTQTTANKNSGDWLFERLTGRTDCWVQLVPAYIQENWKSNFKSQAQVFVIFE